MEWSVSKVVLLIFRGVIFGGGVRPERSDPRERVELVHRSVGSPE
jgi:hypothetical protein